MTTPRLTDEDASMREEIGLLGRDRELRTIDELVGRAARGGGALVISAATPASASRRSLVAPIATAQTAGLRVLRATGVRTFDGKSPDRRIAPVPDVPKLGITSRSQARTWR